MSQKLIDLLEGDDENLPSPEIKAAVSQLETSGEGSVGIYKIGKTQKEYEFITKMDVSEFNFDVIRNEYGGGKYRFYIFDAKGAQITNRVIRIADLPGQKQMNFQQPNSDMTAIAQAMASGFQQLGQLIVQTQQNQPKQPTMMEMMQMMVMMKQAMGGETNGDPMKMFQIFREGMDMGRDMGANKEPAGGMDILNTALTTLGPAIAAAASQPRMMPMPQVQPPMRPAAIPPVTPAMHQPTAALSDQSGVEDMKMYLKMACVKAQQGADPSLYAELVADNVDEQQLGLLLNHADPVGFLTQVVPEVQMYRPWFEKLIEEVKMLLIDEPAPEVTETATQASPLTVAPTSAIPASMGVVLPFGNSYGGAHVAEGGFEPGFDAGADSEFE